MTERAWLHRRALLEQRERKAIILYRSCRSAADRARETFDRNTSAINGIRMQLTHQAAAQAATRLDTAINRLYLFRHGGAHLLFRD